jgi:hypothetical protein
MVRAAHIERPFNFDRRRRLGAANDDVLTRRRERLFSMHRDRPDLTRRTLHEEHERHDGERHDSEQLEDRGKGQHRGLLLDHAEHRRLGAMSGRDDIRAGRWRYRLAHSPGTDLDRALALAR